MNSTHPTSENRGLAEHRQHCAHSATSTPLNAGAREG